MTNPLILAANLDTIAAALTATALADTSTTPGSDAAQLPDEDTHTVRARFTHLADLERTSPERHLDDDTLHALASAVDAGCADSADTATKLDAAALLRATATRLRPAPAVAPVVEQGRDDYRISLDGDDCREALQDAPDLSEYELFALEHLPTRAFGAALNAEGDEDGYHDDGFWENYDALASAAARRALTDATPAQVAAAYLTHARGLLDELLTSHNPNVIAALRAGDEQFIAAEDEEETRALSQAQRETYDKAMSAVLDYDSLAHVRHAVAAAPHASQALTQIIADLTA